MEVFYTINFLVLCIVLVHSVYLQRKPYAHNGFLALCFNVTRTPFYQRRLVVGPPWRTYYAWNIKLDELCMDVSFRPVNKLMIQNFKKDRRLKKHPPWSQAALFMSMGTARGMVLFNDNSGTPGRFIGLPSVDEPTDPEEAPRDLYRMTMKVLHKGRYLLMSDCTTGVTSLMVRQQNRPKRTEIEAIAAEHNFGDPFPACIGETDLIEKPSFTA